MSAKEANKLIQFWSDLKRRKVIRVIPVYAAASFVILELVDILAEPLRLPDWIVNFVLILLCIGFIISVILSWVYDVTSEGIEKTKPISKRTGQQQAIPAKMIGWKIATYISLVIIIGLLIINIFGGRKQAEDIIELEKSIAVLPFENMSDDDEFAHLGDAITDEIIMQLYKINEFEVRSRTSIMQYKNTGKTSPIIGEELKVNYLLEGSTQRYENQVRIRIQFIQASTDDHIWGDIFEGEWEDIFKIQIDVAKQVANKLKTILTPKEIEKIEKASTKNLEAYNLYLKGRYFWNKRTKDGLRKSIIYFQEAIDLDTTYSLAYTGLADSYIVLGEYGLYPANEAFQKAKIAALKAIETDYNLAEAHNALAAVKRDYDWDWSGAEEEYLKAIEMKPNYPTAHQWYSEYLSIMGRHDEAIKRIIHAQELDPLSPIIYSIGGLMAYHYARQYDQAISQCQKALEIDSNYVYAHYALVDNYIQLEMYEEAIKEAKIAVFLSGGGYKSTLATAYALSNKRNEAVVILDELIVKSNRTSTNYVAIARIYLALDMKDQALEWLEKGLRNREFNLIHLNECPQYDALRAEPRFIELLKKIGFEE